MSHWMTIGAKAPTRDARAEAIADALTFSDWSYEEGSIAAWLASPARYAFIVRACAMEEGMYRVIPCDTRQAVLDAYGAQFDIAGWYPHTVLDLDTDEELEFFLAMSFRPIQTSTGE